MGMKGEEIEKVALELVKLHVEWRDNGKVELIQNVFARFAIRLRNRAVREALEGAATRLNRTPRSNNPRKFHQGYEEGLNTAEALLRRLAAELPND